MMFECPRCGGDAVHDGPIMYHPINGYIYPMWHGRPLSVALKEIYNALNEGE